MLLGVSFLFWVLVSFFGCYPRECGLYEASDGPHGPQAPGPVIGSDDEHLKWAWPLTNSAQEKKMREHTFTADKGHRVHTAENIRAAGPMGPLESIKPS